MASGPEYASVGSSLTELVEDYERDGFSGQMGIREGGSLVCFSCREERNACDFSLVAMRRKEGASDPADMCAVAAVVCPSCGAKGTVVLMYGPEAPTEDDEVLRLLDDRRAGSD